MRFSIGFMKIHRIPERSEMKACSRIEIHGRFGTGIEDWTGLEEYRASQWHRVLHFFPGARFILLNTVLRNSVHWVSGCRPNRMPAKAVENYKKALSLGGSRPLPELYLLRRGWNLIFPKKQFNPWLT